METANDTVMHGVGLVCGCVIAGVGWFLAFHYWLSGERCPSSACRGRMKSYIHCSTRDTALRCDTCGLDTYVWEGQQS